MLRLILRLAGPGRHRPRPPPPATNLGLRLQNTLATTTSFRPSPPPSPPIPPLASTSSASSSHLEKNKTKKKEESKEERIKRIAQAQSELERVLHNAHNGKELFSLFLPLSPPFLFLQDWFFSSSEYWRQVYVKIHGSQPPSTMPPPIPEYKQMPRGTMHRGSRDLKMFRKKQE